MKSCITVSLVEEARGGPFVLWDDLPAACQTAAELGFDAIEIFPPGPQAIDPLELQPLLEKHQLRLAAVGTGAGWVKHRLQLADADPGRRDAAIDFVKSIIDIAGQFKAVAIIGSMQGRSDEKVPADQARQFLGEALEVCGEHARQYEVPLIYEPLNRYETNQVNRLADGVALLESLQTDNVKLLADLFHMQIEEADLPAAIRAAGKHIGHVHFVDSNRRPVGQGHIDFAPIISALREIDYQGYLSAEAFPWPSPQAAAKRTIDGFRYWTGRDR